MTKTEKIVVALLGAIAISGAVSAVEVVRMARNGFSVELSMEEAERIVEEVEEAKAVAIKDMEDE